MADWRAAESSRIVTPAGMSVSLMNAPEYSTCIPDPEQGVASAAGAPTDIVLSGEGFRGAVSDTAANSPSATCTVQMTVAGRAGSD